MHLARPRGDREAQGPAIVRWMPLMLLALMMLGMVRHASQPLRDPDVWWHLRLGQDFWDGRSLSEPGPFGAFSTSTWVPTQWLPEMVASKAEEIFGLPAVAWLWGVGLVSVVTGLFVVGRLVGSPLAAASATGMAVVGMGASLSPRPHMISYMLLLVTLYAWLLTMRDLRPRWWLIPLSWVWATSHGMWFIGPVLGLIVVTGLLLDRRADVPAARRMLLVPISSILVAAVTPVGPRLLGAPFAVAGISQFITEWAPPNFRELGPATTLLMIAIVVLVWARSGEVRWWTDILLLAFATGWAVLSARTVTLGAIVAAPLLASVIQRWIPHRPVTPVDAREVRSVLVPAAGALALLAFIAPHTASEPSRVPASLQDELKAANAGTVVFNAYELGGWLMWSQPHLTPVIDGLTESYTRDYLAQYTNANLAAPGWQDFVDRAGVSAALVHEMSPLGQALQDQRDWTLVGSDAGYLLLVPPPR